MPTFTPKLPTSPNPCIGRKDYSGRYLARLHHYNVSLFVGLPGIGKTTLLFHLAQLAREKMDLETSVYLPLFPGEGISSVLARTEARILGRAGQSSESQADAYRRLTDLLDGHKTLLILDNLHCFRHDDLVALLRTVSAYPGGYRIVAGSNEPDLSAMERSLLHVELLKQLHPNEVKEILESRGVDVELRDTLQRDAVRGGASAHPLTLHFVISLCASGRLPDDDFLMGLSARSQKTFQKVWETLNNAVTETQHRVMVTLAHIGLPIEVEFARSILGKDVDELLRVRFIESMMAQSAWLELYGSFLKSRPSLSSATRVAALRSIFGIGRLSSVSRWVFSAQESSWRTLETPNLHSIPSLLDGKRCETLDFRKPT